MKYVGFHALKWPLINKEMDGYITKLKRYKTTISLTLNTDQM